MENKEKLKQQANESTSLPKDESSASTEQVKTKISETWAEDTIADLDDYIESQGIYLRQ